MSLANVLARQRSAICSNTIAAVLTTSCLAVSAWDDANRSAQDSPPPPVMPPPYLFMLANELIRNELAISPEQFQQIGLLHEEYVRTAPPPVVVSKDPAATSDRAAAEKARTAEVARTEDLETRTKRILSPAQLIRIEQLRLRARGPWVVFEPAVQKSLGISESQLLSARKVIDSCDAECARLAQRARQDKSSVLETMARVDETTRAAFDKIVTLLTDSQQRELNGLLGSCPPFDPGKLRYRLVGKPVRN